MELYGFKNFDELLAFHCSPVLAGIKPSNLISLPNSDSEEIDTLLFAYNQQFKERGIVFRRLCACSKRSLLFVYNSKALQELLSDPGYRAYLIAAGYEQKAALDEDLKLLEDHLQTGKGFPHEIGVFLGYPLEDVLGFIIHNGNNCKYSGYWKVYGDVSKAQKIFAAYESCRDYTLQKLAEGLPLHMAAVAI